MPADWVIPNLFRDLLSVGILKQVQDDWTNDLGYTLLVEPIYFSTSAKNSSVWFQARLAMTSLYS